MTSSTCLPAAIWSIGLNNTIHPSIRLERSRMFRRLPLFRPLCHFSLAVWVPLVYSAGAGKRKARMTI